MLTTPTVITLGASNPSPIYGQAEVITATVTTNPPDPADTPTGGEVVFMDGSNTLGSPQALVNGIATLSTTSLALGIQVLTAVYSGTPIFASSTTTTTPQSIIDTVAGGDQGGPATSSAIASPNDVAVDAAGDIFIADTENNEIREVNHTTGAITTVAGDGVAGYSGDSGPATEAELDGPMGIALDSAGDLFIADTGNNAIREVNEATGIITTIAGNGTAGFSGDTGPYSGVPTDAELNAPEGVAVDPYGNIFIADTGNNEIRAVVGGKIYFFAGEYTPQVASPAGYNGAAGTAVAMEFNGPEGVAVDQSDDVFIADAGNDRIREVNASTGDISTVAGTGTASYNGDGGQARSADLDYPSAVAVDAAGDLFIADTGNDRIREVDANSQQITTVAGDGSPDYGGDGGPATQAALSFPVGLAVDAAGDIFIADSINNRIREVNHATGQITTIAGDGAAGYTGDHQLAIDAELNDPVDVALNASGTDLYIADTGNNVIREVDLATGVITTVAGNGTPGYKGDGQLAIAAELDGPASVRVDSAGDLIIADTVNNVIREVVASSGDIITVAGNGNTGDSGDGGAPTDAELDNPEGVAVDAAGDIFIADTSNDVIREVSGGVITTAAGTPGLAGYSGDGGPATQAELYYPLGIAVDAQGNLYIADAGNDVIREVDHANQLISTVVGNATAPGFAGDGGLATYASMFYPDSVVVDGSGDLFIADGNNDRIREVSSVTGAVTVTVVKADLTVTATSISKPYGAALPTLTYTISGFIDGENSGVVSGAPVITTTATASSHVSGGPYSITVALGTLSAAGYTFNFVEGSLTITPVPLTITAADAIKIYGAALPAFTAVYDGFVNGDSASSPTFTPPAFSTTATSASNVQEGGYPITVSGARDSDYSISYASATLTITPAPLMVAANSASKVYGSAVPPLTYTISGFVDGDNASAVFGSPVLTTPANSASGAGSYPISIAPGSLTAADYDFPAADFFGGSLTVTPAPLTISANPETWVAGQSYPALSVSYSGFVDGDSPASLAVPPSVITPANQYSGPGSYPIVVDGAGSPNYIINYAGNTLTILPAPVTVEGISIRKISAGGHKSAQVIVLDFSGALNAGDADDLGNYGLVTVAQGRKRSKAVPFSRASYNAADNTLTLTTAKKLALNPPLLLTVYSGGMLDTLGRPLDGNDDGQPGGNFVATLSKGGTTIESAVVLGRRESSGEMRSMSRRARTYDRWPGARDDDRVTTGRTRRPLDAESASDAGASISMPSPGIQALARADSTPPVADAMPRPATPLTSPPDCLELNQHEGPRGRSVRGRATPLPDDAFRSIC